jgi:hypothetical protein
MKIGDTVKVNSIVNMPFDGGYSRFLNREGVISQFSNSPGYDFIVDFRDRDKLQRGVFYKEELTVVIKQNNCKFDIGDTVVVLEGYIVEGITINQYNIVYEVVSIDGNQRMFIGENYLEKVE